MNNVSIPQKLNLRANDWVVVRTKAEILSTLDERGRLDELPFQPEMFAYCGRKMRVRKVAHKTCDVVRKTGGRSMRNAVHLEFARCDGSMHGGCQAGCSFFWKEAWLKRAADTTVAEAPAATACTEATVRDAARLGDDEADPDPVWVCQTTATFEATDPLEWWDVRQYVRDITTGNHSAWHMIKLLLDTGYRNLVHRGVGYRLLIRSYNMFKGLIRGRAFPEIAGVIPEGRPTPSTKLDLTPGEWVQVKSGDEIAATLNTQGFNRGLRYDIEMLKYSGNRYRVEMRVDRLINEQTGKMMRMKNPCIQLEDVYCRAECTSLRIGCPRASNTYWREIWLRRVEESSPLVGSPNSSRIPVREVRGSTHRSHNQK